MKKKNKDFERKQKVAEAIVNIRTAIDQFNRLANDHFSAAEEAIRMGQEEYAEQLLESQVDMESWADDLKFLELKVRTESVTAESLNDLKGLKDVFATCNKLFGRGGIKFGQIGEEMSKLMDSLSANRRGLKDLRDSLTKKQTGGIYAEIFGERKMDDTKIKEKVAEKKKALEAKIYASLNSDKAIPVPTSVEAPVAAKVDDIAAMIDEEIRKS